MPRRTPHPCYKQPQNRGLSCDEGEDKCEKCGWNPEEQERRKQKNADTDTDGETR